MPRYIAEPLAAGCPWSGWAPPNVDWCEAQVCSVVVNPADTWSNLAYLAVGVWMWRAARREGDGSLALFGPAAIFVAFASGMYHASYTAFFQFFDFVSMFVFTMVIISANAVRLGWIPAQRAPLVGLVGVVGSSALVPLVSETAVPIQAMVAAHIAVILPQEVVALRERGDGERPVDRRGLWLGVALMIAAAGFSAADVTRTWCNPANHVVSGHALWHLLTAAALASLFIYFRGLSRQG